LDTARQKQAGQENDRERGNRFVKCHESRNNLQ
jgi:hypothetical protein